jgi:hypothetical protein
MSRPAFIPAMLAIAAMAAGAWSGCQAGDPPPAVAALKPADAERELGRQLDGRRLSYRYVACVRNGRRFAGAAVVRCNVNFGAPHIEVYCVVRRDGRLLTDHDDPSIPCPRDSSGEGPPVQTYGSSAARQVTSTTFVASRASNAR